MADSIKLCSIKRVDPYVKEILASATHVALYIFNTATNEWEKTETEGALFVYSRNGEPYHSIMVMNRLNAENLIEPIVKEFDYQMQVPFLLYRNSKSKIFGIWFFNREECVRITYLIESLMEGLKDKSDDKSKKSENGVDIFSMLSKAQEDFNKTPTKQESQPPTFSSTPRGPDVTQSVVDFFAKASSKSTSKANGNGEYVLQRLMSNPAHSVEHIEKQQRSITPQEQGNVKIKQNDRRSVPAPVCPTNNPEPLNDRSLKMLSSPYQPPTGQSPLAFLLQNQTQVAEENDALGTSPFSQFLDAVQKPQLMTPMMFTAPQPEKKENVSLVSRNEDTDKVDLLTESQLAQALIYLLKNNAEFTKKIHEAYVSSIMEKVNKSLI